MPACSGAPRGTLSLSGMLERGCRAWGSAAPALLLAAISLFVIALAEDSRIPVDDPNARRAPR